MVDSQNNSDPASGPYVVSMRRHYLNLIAYKTYADLRAESERTYAGYLWWIIEPIFSMVVYYFVFKVVLQRGTEDFVPFLLIGIMSWKWFASSAKSCMTQISSNKRLMKQVYLPKHIFPLVTIFKNSFKFIVAFGVLLLFLWVYGFLPGVCYVALPCIMLAQLLLIAAVAFPLAAAHPFLPDIAIPVDLVLQAAFFLSGIFYSVDSLSEGLQEVFFLNPMAFLIASYRSVLMHNEFPSWSGLGYVVLGAVFFIAIGWSVMKKYDRLYPRVVN